MHEQARQFGLAWERLPDPRATFNLEIYMPGDQREFFVLGPHAPHLTASEISLLHQLWLRFSEQVAPEELHHHDVVHFALDEVMQEIDLKASVVLSTASSCAPWGNTASSST